MNQKLQLEIVARKNRSKPGLSFAILQKNKLKTEACTKSYEQMPQRKLNGKATLNCAHGFQ